MRLDEMHPMIYIKNMLLFDLKLTGLMISLPLPETDYAFPISTDKHMARYQHVPR